MWNIFNFAYTADSSRVCNILLNIHTRHDVLASVVNKMTDIDFSECWAESCTFTFSGYIDSSFPENQQQHSNTNNNQTPSHLSGVIERIPQANHHFQCLVVCFHNLQYSGTDFHQLLECFISKRKNH